VILNRRGSVGYRGFRARAVRADRAVLSETGQWPPAGRGRADAAIYLLQHWFNLSDPTVEYALYAEFASRFLFWPPPLPWRYTATGGTWDPPLPTSTEPGDRNTGIECARFDRATGTVTSFREIAEMVIRIADQPVPIEEQPRSGPMPHNGYRDFDTTACRLASPDFSFVPLQHGSVKMLR
jgi:hypothetical protein